MLDRELLAVMEATSERDEVLEGSFECFRKENEPTETAKERKRKKLVARTEKLLARRDRLMEKVHRRMEPDRSDLSIKTWRLWEKVGAINRSLQKLDRELVDLANDGQEEGRGKETYQGRISGNYVEAVQ